MSLKITINDKVYNAEKGEYILDVCRRNNIFIPTLCHHDSLSGIGSCRLCVVEMDEGKGNRTVISCVYPLCCDCKVHTESKKIIGIRKTILSMLLTRAPKGEGLSSLCQIYNVEQDTRFAPAAELPAVSKTDKGCTLLQQSFRHLALSCILCGLCTQACASLGTGAISTVGRGVEKKVSTPYDEPSSDCIGCASCASVCPKAAIVQSESNGTRTIWGREFRLLNCNSCGKSFATKEEYALSLKKASPENLDNLSADVSCEECRRKKSADVFADAFGVRCS